MEEHQGSKVRLGLLCVPDRYLTAMGGMMNTIKMICRIAGGGLLLLLTACAPVSIPHLTPLTDSNFLSPKGAEPGPYKHSTDVEPTPLPMKKGLIPPVGVKNAYGVEVTPELKLAYETYLGGDYEQAMKALDQAEQKGGDAGMLWQISFLRAQVLILMGRAADAEVELDKKTSQLEIKFIGSNWNSRALRGEVKLWLYDYEGAKHDLYQVVNAAGNWSMPTSYALPPSNMPELVGIASAQLRAYMTLAIVYIMEEKYEQARDWAAEAESKFNDIHYVTQHPLYGRNFYAHADSYYGRANNLIFLGAATLAVTKDIAASDKIFDKARAFFHLLDFEDGIVSLEALRARTLTLIGQDELGNKAAEEALRLAHQQGTTDLIWRVEVLRGEILLKMHRDAEAEEAFRHAQSSIDQVSGILVSDQAKIRFGIGKEDVAYYLSQIDAKKQDYAKLFEDMERARARAFVDMLAGRALASGRQEKLVSRVQQLNQQIIRLQLINYSPGNFVSKDKPQEKALMDERLELLRQLRQKDPELADVLSIASRPLAQIQSALRAGEMLLYFLPPRGTDAVKILEIGPSQASIHTLAVTWSDIQKQLDQFSATIGIPAQATQNRGLVLKYAAQGAGGGNTPAQALARLGQSLELTQWNKATTLYIVPSGPLHFMPWGGLDLNMPVVVLPNGGWLVRNPYSFRPQVAASVIGDPAFGGELPQLPGARLEAERVADIYHALPLLGGQATEQELRAGVGSGVRVLHFATHAIYEPSNPLDSALFLSDHNKATPLTASALYAHPLPAQLVVMSACETGMGKVTSGEDLLGLSRSFYLGGTRAILSSLWPIEDEGTKRFMQIFHERAQHGDYGQAWLDARNLLKQEGYPPVVYGAFVLGGARFVKE